MKKNERDEIKQLYWYFLGRNPESEDVIDAKLGLDIETVRNNFMNSAEYQYKITSENVEMVIFGNCQAAVYESIISISSHIKCKSFIVEPNIVSLFSKKSLYIKKLIEYSDIICIMCGFEWIAPILVQNYNIDRSNIRIIPNILVNAFHPDMVYISTKNGKRVGEYNSRIAAFCYINGLSVEESIKYYNNNIFRLLGYYSVLLHDRQRMAVLSNATGIHLCEILEKWISSKICFMHSVNHPKMSFLADVSFEFLKKNKIAFNNSKIQYLEDRLQNNNCWLPYPDIAKNLGLESDYLFKVILAGEAKPKLMDLNDFLIFQYEQLSCVPPDQIVFSEADNRKLELFRKQILGADNRAQVTAPKPAAPNPYKNLADHQFWRRSVSALPAEQVDPVTHPRFSIQKHEKVATAGSCFAQHIARTLSKSGFNYFVPEDSDAADAEERNYRVYSARYGNIYSTKQLLQLFYRAYGRFVPAEEVWVREDGKLVDPYRPQIEPEGFATIEALRESRDTHLAAVRQMFEQADVFVFTLGLTEIWRSKTDGAVFPLAPGVVAGQMDEDRYEFANLGVDDIRTDLQVFIDQLHAVNPRVKVLLTVSPVPLMATYEDRHVYCSTTLSKSVLRVVADQICSSNPHVDYFPSYEIITGNFTRGAYFEDDLRSVKPEGVAHVMRLFMQHYGGQEAVGTSALEYARAQSEVMAEEYEQLSKIVCDEEALDKPRMKQKKAG